ncbi:alpha/beta hydrolase [Botrimarina mediterranea]|uniref:Thermostable monoacylglycerol lipase n=1 Tax=Botrimarina mediterranea TaxID=2528022 RepID=A0A518K382_9BACT|nr:alpha/beta fold hydrolase [Botrimarina mediterranea]QDV72268.1 Thermostable monoacylglycerol lipase [Botrimarina mediterranea]QDV76812.1 Thermostable monoacylglycerol lipase [Planctomycetes bacterium K2D]
MSDTTVDEAPKRRRWLRILLIAAVAFVPLHLLADMVYTAYVACAIDAWEETITRDLNGVIEGCDTFDVPPSGDADTDTAILLVHGLGASPQHYEFIAEDLAERGYHCRSVRLPGFAEPVAKYRESTSKAWLEKVRSELASLRKEHDRVGVVGHSLGGAVTIGVLLDDPQAADFAVLLAPAVEVSDARSPVLSARTWHEVSERSLVFVNVLSSPYPLDCRDPERSDHPGRTPFTPKAIVDQLFKLMDRNRGRAEEITVPTTVVVAIDDPIVDTPAAERFYEHLGSTDKDLVRLDNSGHEVTLDWQWEEVANAIAQRASAGEPATSVVGGTPE